MGLRFANASLKDYINHSEDYKELAEYFSSITPEYKEIYDDFMAHWGEATSVLTEDEKKIFALRVIQKIPAKDICEATKISPPAMSKMLSGIYQKVALYYFQEFRIIFDEAI